MSQELDARIEDFYKRLEEKTSLSRQEIEYKSLQLLNWWLDKARAGDRIGVLKKENGKSYMYRPALDIFEESYQQ